ncbi:MAG: protein kinase [Fibrobacteria bacterium]|nr:protein kinase [Fibrobacteria bacterium]
MKRKIAAVALGLVLPLLWVVGEALGFVPVDLLYATTVGMQGPGGRAGKEGVSPVLLLEIDNSSLDELGPWPWPRGNVEEIVRRVLLWGARALVIDPSVVQDPDNAPDPTFWDALPGGTPLVAPLQRSSGGTPCPGRFPPSLASAAKFVKLPDLAPPAGLPCSERFVWGFDALPAPGTLAWPMVGSDGQNLIPSLPVAALLASSRVDNQRADWWGESERAILAARGDVKVNPDGTVLMRPYGPPGASVAHVSATSVLSGELAEDQFRDRIVVLGVTTSRLAEHMEVPFSAPMVGRTMSRPEALANILSNLIEQDQCRETSWARYAGLLLAIVAAITMLLGVRLRRTWIPMMSSGILAAIALSGVGVLLVKFHLWVPPLGGIIVPVGTLLFGLLWPRRKRLPPPREIPPASAIHRESSLALALPPRPRHDETGYRPTTGVGTSDLPPDRPSTTNMPVRTVDEATSVVLAAKGQVGQILRAPNGEYTQLGRYVDLRPLASGGMCKVYEGRDPLMDRRVAIKILRADKAKGQTTEQRFLREAKVAGSLNHPNINTVFDFGQVEDILFLVLEFVDGQTLSQWIREHNGVQPGQLVPWIRQIADALDSAHQAKVIHRDIKPSNFMIVNTTGSIKLMDFGVARTPDVSLTQAGTTVGTPNYMSPEQLQGSRVGPLADLYSCGIVVYQMLSQRLPFHGEGLTALCNNILKGQGTKLSVHRPDLAGPVEAVVHKAFAVKPEDRYQNCSDFAEAFAKAVGN